MAAIKETIIIVKLSELVKDNNSPVNEFTDVEKSIEEIVQQLVPQTVIVEVERA